MSNVEFEENNFSVGIPLQQATTTPTLVRLILKTGIAKDEKQANFVLIGVAVSAFLLTVYVIYSSFFSRPTPKPLPVQQNVPARPQNF